MKTIDERELQKKKKKQQKKTNEGKKLPGEQKL